MIIRDLEPGDAGWVLERHGVHYTSAEGFDHRFEPLVARLLSDFLAHRDPSCERGWIASNGADRLGCVFLRRGDAATARLHLFYVVPAARGSGVAQALLSALLAFAAEAGYRSVRLATFERHRAAGRVYARNGFSLLESREVRSFGLSLVEESWEKRLDVP